MRARSRPWPKLPEPSRIASLKSLLSSHRRALLLTLPRIMLKFALLVSNGSISREAMWRTSIYRIGSTRFCSSIATSRNSMLLLKIQHWKNMRLIKILSSPRGSTLKIYSGFTSLSSYTRWASILCWKKSAARTWICVKLYGRCLLFC